MGRHQVWMGTKAGCACAHVRMRSVIKTAAGICSPDSTRALLLPGLTLAAAGPAPQRRPLPAARPYSTLATLRKPSACLSLLRFKVGQKHLMGLCSVMSLAAGLNHMKAPCS